MRHRLALAVAVTPILAWAAFRLWLIAAAPVPAPLSFADVRAAHRASDVLVLDRRGEVIHELRTDARRRRLGWTPLDEISPALTAAVLTSEDRRFHAHGGVDGRAVVAAAVRRARGGPTTGASTITMQVATLVDPELRRRGGPRTLAQKWRQMRLAWRIEATWNKREILETYLNLVAFRGEIEGVAAASSVLFGKSPHGIGGAEGAVLAALLRAPNAGREVVVRRAVALAATQCDAVSRQTIEATAAQVLDAPTGAGPRVAIAPHAAARLVPPGRAAGAGGQERRGASILGAAVRTTLDGALQRAAAESLRRHLSAVRGEHVRDGAVVVADNETGEVLAYVGGSGDLGSARHVDGVQAHRQAGSTLKPFFYAEAIDRRLLTAASAIEDTPLDVAVAGGLYRPRNYDEGWKGLVSVRTALASSLNVPAVRVLDMVGEESAVELLRRLGFAGLSESGDYYGPSIALGSADVSLWELVNAYRALARGGTWTPLRLGAVDSAGGASRVYSERAVFVVSSILSDRESRSATFGLENPLATRFWTAVKTGTSKDMRDNWCVGYSRRYTVGVWVGNFDGTPMRNVSGITGAAPVWAEVMAWLHAAEGSAPPAAPTGVVAARVVPPGAGEARVEWFLSGTEPPPAATTMAGHPRIVAPVSGTIIALDPDIPTVRERLVFEAVDAREPMRFVLDGRDLGPARDLHVWRPSRGKHVLALVDADARVVDRVSFEVRGVPRASSTRAGADVGSEDRDCIGPSRVGRGASETVERDAATCGGRESTAAEGDD